MGISPSGERRSNDGPKSQPSTTLSPAMVADSISSLCARAPSEDGRPTASDQAALNTYRDIRGALRDLRAVFEPLLKLQPTEGHPLGDDPGFREASRTFVVPTEGSASLFDVIRVSRCQFDGKPDLIALTVRSGCHIARGADILFFDGQRLAEAPEGIDQALIHHEDKHLFDQKGEAFRIVDRTCVLSFGDSDIHLSNGSIPFSDVSAATGQDEMQITLTGHADDVASITNYAADGEPGARHVTDIDLALFSSQSRYWIARAIALARQ